MKQKLIAAAGALALIAAGAGAGSMISSAEAQTAPKPPVILIVSQELLVGQSDAGKTIPTQANTIKAAIEKELQGEADKLKKDIENYQKGASLMSEEVRKKTEQDLSVRQQVSLPQQAQIMEQVFAGAVQNAQGKILQESQPIMKAILDKRGGTILLDRSAVMYAAPETDITQEVLAELNKKLKTVPVQKVTLADVKKKLAEAQAAQNKPAEKPKK
ncbi:MAG: OmpH family outer membrane protein [Parvularculaceae bacterium]|nr:OmpH family outer membrane protein [Parvularculaceae bacterium]